VADVPHTPLIGDFERDLAAVPPAGLATLEFWTDEAGDFGLTLARSPQ